MSVSVDEPRLGCPPRNCVSAPSLILKIHRNETAREKWTSSVQRIGIARSFANNTSGKDYTPPSLDRPFSNQLTARLEASNDLSWRRMLISREKLKASSTTSEVLAAFGLITMVELQINYPTEVPEWLFILFALNTTVIVSLNVLSIMISTYILPGIEAAATIGHHDTQLFAESPHDRMKKFTEIAWVLSNILGLILFFFQLSILLWVKFWDFSFNAALSAMVVIVPFLCIFIGSGLYFYHVLAVIKSKKCLMEVRELEHISHNLDSVV